MAEHFLYKSGGNFYIRKSGANYYVYTVVPSCNSYCINNIDTSGSKYTLLDNQTYCFTSNAELVTLSYLASCDVVDDPPDLIASGSSYPLCISTYSVDQLNGNGCSYLIVSSGTLRGTGSIEVGDLATLNINSGTLQATGIIYEITNIDSGNPSDLKYHLGCVPLTYDSTGCIPLSCCQGYFNTSDPGSAGLCMCSNFDIITPEITGYNIWTTEALTGGSPTPPNPTSPTFGNTSSGLTATYSDNGIAYNQGIWKTNQPINLYGYGLHTTGNCIWKDCVATGIKLIVHLETGDGIDDAFGVGGVMSQSTYFNNTTDTVYEVFTDPIAVGSSQTVYLNIANFSTQFKKGYLYWRGIVNPDSSASTRFRISSMEVLISNTG